MEGTEPLKDVSLRDISKTFRQFTVLGWGALYIRSREFLVLAGPSGCAKFTFLRMVTGEAMTMANRIVGMVRGKVLQIGAPLDFYGHPVNKFVAGFIGLPLMNFIPEIVSGGMPMKAGRLPFQPGMSMGATRAHGVSRVYKFCAGRASSYNGQERTYSSLRQGLRPAALISS